MVALIGKSGTGKSHKALSVAGQNDIEMIIDDGLLIYGNRVVAGTSPSEKIPNLLQSAGLYFLIQNMQTRSEKR